MVQITGHLLGGIAAFGQRPLGAMPDGGVYDEKVVLNDITLWSAGAGR